MPTRDRSRPAAHVARQTEPVKDFITKLAAVLLSLQTPPPSGHTYVRAGCGEARHVQMVSCHARFMDVRPDAGSSSGATVRLSAVEVRALVNILGLVAAGGSPTEKPERDMAMRLQAELETALGDS
jgi:hypothetical protein